MSFSRWCAPAVCAMLFIGCGESDKKEPKKTDAGKPKAAKVAKTAAQGDPTKPDANTPDTKPTEKEGPYLPLPETMPQGIKRAYGQLTAGAANGQAMALLNLAGISQQIGSQLSESDPKTSYAFFKQSAAALREGAKTYPGDLPGSFTGPVFFNEACALAKDGDVEAATASLKEAVTGGFSDFNMIREDQDLDAVRAVDGFEDKLRKWELAAIEKIKEHAKSDLAAGESFPFELSAKDVNGADQSLEQYLGKVVIVDVWGTWCPPCRKEIPSFIKLQDKLGADQFQMIGLNYEREDTDEENLKKAVDYIAEHGINYPCIMGDDKTKDQIPDFGGFPTTLFIDKAGKVRMKAVGLHEYAYLEAVVTELLAEETPPTGEDGKEAKPEEATSDEPESEEGKSDDAESGEAKSEEGKSEEGKSEEGKSEEGKSEEGKSEEGKSEEGKEAKSDGSSKNQ